MKKFNLIVLALAFISASANAGTSAVAGNNIAVGTTSVVDNVSGNVATGNNVTVKGVTGNKVVAAKLDDRARALKGRNYNTVGVSHIVTREFFGVENGGTAKLQPCPTNGDCCYNCEAPSPNNCLNSGGKNSFLCGGTTID